MFPRTQLRPLLAFNRPTTFLLLLDTTYVSQHSFELTHLRLYFQLPEIIRFLQDLLSAIRCVTLRSRLHFWGVTDLPSFTYNTIFPALRIPLYSGLHLCVQNRKHKLRFPQTSCSLVVRLQAPLTELQA